MKKENEEIVIVLDFLLHGYIGDRRSSHQKTSIVQAITPKNFTLLELIPKKDMQLQPYEEVYIGAGKRDKINNINGKLKYEKLSNTAKSELFHVIKDIIKKDEMRFVDFFNNARPLNTRVHIMELLPGVGKKHMLEIIAKRDDKPFESLLDLKTRVRLMSDPEKVLANRIVSELEEKEKYNLFVK